MCPLFLDWKFTIPLTLVESLTASAAGICLSCVVFGGSDSAREERADKGEKGIRAGDAAGGQGFGHPLAEGASVAGSRGNCWIRRGLLGELAGPLSDALGGAAHGRV